jgi:hypothetical protein
MSHLYWMILSHALLAAAENSQFLMNTFHLCHELLEQAQETYTVYLVVHLAHWPISKQSETMAPQTKDYL